MPPCHWLSDELRLQPPRFPFPHPSTRTAIRKKDANVCTSGQIPVAASSKMLACTGDRRFLPTLAGTQHLGTGGVSACEKKELEMPLLQILLVLVVVGVLLWLVNSFIPMQGTIKSLLNAVVVIATVLWLLNVFGLFHSLSHIRVGA